MEERSRLKINLLPGVKEKNYVIYRDNGLKRSAVIALLINEKWKEEYADEK